MFYYYLLLYAFWRERIYIDPVVFSLIIIKKDYCTVSKKIFLSPFWNRILFLQCYFSNVNLFMFSYFETNFIEKFLWESDFQILAKIKMTQNKNRLFGRHFEKKNLSRIIIPYNANIYGANFITNSGRKVAFLGGSMDPSWAPTEVKVWPWSLKC